jgi:hypothetical protein
VQPLTVDTTLNFIAQNYANHLAKKNTGLIHSSQTQEFNIKGLILYKPSVSFFVTCFKQSDNNSDE